MLTERQREAMDHTMSLCVTAGAGAGKTYTLVERYVSLLKDGVGVSEVLALTFTEKAAAEMKHKVRKAVMELEGPRWDRVKDDVNWCRISTFHAFCKSVLDEFPLETGVAPGFEVLEEVDRSELLAEAMDRLLAPPIEEAVEDALVRLLTDVPRPKLADSLRFLHERRTEVSGFLASFETKEDLRARWTELQARCQKEVADRFLSDVGLMNAVSELRDLARRHRGGSTAGCKYLAAVAPFLDGIAPGVDPEAICRSIASLRAVKGSRKIGDQKTFGPDLERLRSAYCTLVDAFERSEMQLVEDDPEELTDRAASLLVDLKLVCGTYSGIVREMKRERNAIDFEDMIEIVHRLFESDPDLVREEFTDRYRYIMVDEFQDTDAVQSEIIWMMAGEDKAAERLFIVGDPKQSIYLFRNVDVSMFKSFQNKIVDVLGGRTVHLDTSFRSSPQVIGFVNHVFGRLMREARERYEFAYQDMRVCDLRKEDAGSVELLLLPDADGSEEDIVARRVQEMVEKGTNLVYWSQDGKEHLDEPRPAGYGDIAILLRAKTHLHLLEEALDRYGIPYRVHGGLGFFERQEITDLDNLLAFLSCREDDLSLYGILRSPYFAISDERLFHAANGARGSLWEKLSSRGADAGEEVNAAVKRLERWLHYANRLTVPQLLMRIYDESGIFAVYGGLPDGDQRMANIEKLLSMARSAQSSGFLSLADFRRWLKLSREGGAKEGLAQLTGGEGSVKVMTVHAAKGLEFPIVFVPEMNFYRGGGSPILAFSDTAGLAMDAPDVANGHKLVPTMAKRAIEAENERKEAAERKRLLYVALTRAKDHLVMCGHAPSKSETGRDLWINSIMEATSLREEDIEAGVKRLGPELEMRIRTDPSSIDAEPRTIDPETRLSAEEVAPLIVGRERIEIPPSPPMLSPSHVQAAQEEITDLPQTTRSEVPEMTARGGAALDSIPTVRGTIVHEILSGKDAVAVLRKYGIDDPAKVEAYSGMYERFMADPIMANVSVAYRELAFMAKIGEDIYKGRIDLLLQNEDGSWHLVDHKTGSFEGRMGEDKVKEYREQMKVYQAAIEQLVRKKVTSSLYLVDESRTLTL